jgi:hypothetical protein
MTDPAVMNAFGDGLDIHAPVPVDIHGNGPVREAEADRIVCACGAGYFPCARTPIDDGELAQLERLDALASPGPWFPEPPYSPGTRPGDTYGVVDARGIALVDAVTFPDANMIAAARTQLPRLVLALRQARAANAELAATLREIETTFYPPEGQ